jgi:hypothetical protein
MVASRGAAWLHEAWTKYAATRATCKPFTSLVSPLAYCACALFALCEPSTIKVLMHTHTHHRQSLAHRIQQPPLTTLPHWPSMNSHHHQQCIVVVRRRRPRRSQRSQETSIGHRRTYCCQQRAEREREHRGHGGQLNTHVACVQLWPGGLVCQLRREGF